MPAPTDAPIDAPVAKLKPSMVPLCIWLGLALFGGIAEVTDGFLPNTLILVGSGGFTGYCLAHVLSWPSRSLLVFRAGFLLGLGWIGYMLYGAL